MLIPLLLLASPTAPAATDAAAKANPPVRVTFNDDGRYVYGDKAKVYVRPAQDGYLVVLRSDARGNVRVLSPLDPNEDQAVSAGKKYEAKGRDGHEAFVAEDTSGQGVVLAAWSRTPFDVARFERNAHWDGQALGDAAGQSSHTGGDAETRLQSVVDAMKPGGHYDYDAATYQVLSPRMARTIFAYPYPYAGWNGWWGYDPWWGWGPDFGPRVIVTQRFGFRAPPVIRRHG